MMSLPVPVSIMDVCNIISFFVFRSCSCVCENDLIWKTQTSVSGSVCLQVPIFWHLRAHTICAFGVWVRSMHVWFSRVLKASIVSNLRWGISSQGTMELGVVRITGRAGWRIYKKLWLFLVLQIACCWYHSARKRRIRLKRVSILLVLSPPDLPALQTRSCWDLWPVPLLDWILWQIRWAIPGRP